MLYSLLPVTDEATLKRSSRALRLEPLEQRHLLTGARVGSDPQPTSVIDLGFGDDLLTPDNNVDVCVIDGRLVVRGDAGNNSVTISNRGHGVYWVQGSGPISPAWGARNTAINHQLLGRIPWGDTENITGWVLEFRGATEGIDVDLGTGDDYLHLVGRIGQDVGIHMGDGDDRVLFGYIEDPLNFPFIITMSIKWPVPTKIDGDLTIDMGPGDDLVRAFAEVQGDADIRFGAGDDTLDETQMGFLEESVSPVLRVGGIRTIDFGPGENGPDPLTESGCALPPDFVRPPSTVVSPVPLDCIVFPPGVTVTPDRTGLVADPSQYTYTKVAANVAQTAWEYFQHEQDPARSFVPPDPQVEIRTDGHIRVEITANSLEGLLITLRNLGAQYEVTGERKVIAWVHYGRFYGLQISEDVAAVTAAEREFVGPVRADG